MQRSTILSAVTILASAAAPSLAAILVTTTYTQDFNTLQSTPNVAASAGTAPTWTNNSTLSGWYGGGTGTLAAGYAVSDGSLGTVINTGTVGVGSFGTLADSDRAAAPLKRNNAAFVAVALQNNNASPIVQLNIGYTGEQWRDNAVQTAGLVGLDFSYQIGATDITTGTWTTVTAGNFTAASTSNAGVLNGNDPANRSAIAFSITGLNVTSGQQIWLRWAQRGTGNNGSHVAVDDLTVTAVVPEPASLAFLGLGGLALVRRRREAGAIRVI